MTKNPVSRRGFLGASAAGAAVGFSAIADPAAAAAQAVGIRKSDLPDLTIKEVKAYVMKGNPRGEPVAGMPQRTPTGMRIPQETRILSIVTNSGIEGNYMSRRETDGLLEFAKGLLVGKSAISRELFQSLKTSNWTKAGRARIRRTSLLCRPSPKRLSARGNIS